MAIMPICIMYIQRSKIQLQYYYLLGANMHVLTVQECKMDLMSDECTVYNGTP